MQSDRGRKNFKRSMKESPSIDWWRWLVMPLACLLGAVLGTMVIFVIYRISTLINGFDPDQWWPQFVENIFILCSFGYFWSSIAYLVAPKNKLLSANIMIAVYGLACVFLLIFFFNQDLLPKGYIIQLFICFIFSLALSIYGIIHKHRNYQDYQQLQ